MNLQNYATQPTAQRLVDAGIVLETDFYHSTKGWGIVTKKYKESYPEDPCIPAPSMAEIWRELPEEYRCHILTMIKWNKNRSLVGYEFNHSWIYYVKDTNPTDALIDLLIWVTEQKGKEKP